MSLSLPPRLKAALAVLAASCAALAALAAPAAASSSKGDLRALWLLDEGRGQILRDSKGNNTKGVLGEGPSVDDRDPSWVAGMAPGTWALRFDGFQYVDIRSHPSLESESVTLAARVRAGGSPGQYRYVAGKGASSCEAASYALYTGGSGGLHFYVSDGQAFALSPGPGREIWDGQWHTVVGTYDGRDVRLYVDGQEVGSGTPTDVAVQYDLSTNRRFMIGGYGGTCSLFFRGDIDAVAVLRAALGPSEVAGVGELLSGR